MKHAFRKLAHYYSGDGVRGVLRKIFEFVRQRCWSETQWLVYEALLLSAPAAGPGRLLRREIGLRDLIDARHAKACAFPEATSQRLKAGQTCHGFYLGDRIATVGWSTQDHLELDEDVRISCPGGVGLFDFITFEEFRSRGYYTDALLQLLAEMRRRGFARALIAVDPGNVASIRGIEKAGFTPASRVTRRRRCGLRFLARRMPDWKCAESAAAAKG